MLLGCIGDDFTGSSDLANTLARQGMRVVQYTGVPDQAADATVGTGVGAGVGAGVDAGVVALKSRSIKPADAVRISLDALEWLQAQGCEQFFFKYCSTFDSTADGNIGPVVDALADALGAHRVIVCPAFPGTGRSVYQGHLFVNDTLLSESGMQDHPLNPMTDPDIRRCLQAQTRNSVGHVAASAVLGGKVAIAAALETEHARGHRLIVVDALRDEDLMAIGAAAADLPLVTGGSGVALGLPANFIARGELSGADVPWRGESGLCVALSGSCSAATRAQVARHREHSPALPIDAAEVIEGRQGADDVADWLLESSGVPLAYSSADPSEVTAVQRRFGRERAATALEGFFADVARRVVAQGVRKILTAGGETSGAVVEGLALDRFEIGPEIDPGVPCLRAGEHLVVALKSGNFGAPDFFEKAARAIGAES